MYPRGNAWIPARNERICKEIDRRITEHKERIERRYGRKPWFGKWWRSHRETIEQSIRLQVHREMAERLRISVATLTDELIGEGKSIREIRAQKLIKSGKMRTLAEF